MAAYDITEVENIALNPLGVRGGSISLIDSTHFVGAISQTSTADGYVGTYSLDGSYQIALIDQIEQDTDTGVDNAVIVYDSSHFVLAYGGSGSDGFIKTFSFDGSYDNITEISSVEFDTINGTQNDIDLIDSTHPIVVFRGTSDDGFVSIFTIDGSDVISETSTYEFDTVQTSDPKVKVIDSTHALICWVDSLGDGNAQVITWDGSYVISTVGSAFEFSAANTEGLSLEKLDTEYYALSYRGEVGTDVYVKILRVNTSSSYALSEIDNEILSTNTANYTAITKLQDGLLLVVYGDNTVTDMFVRTLTYDGSYSLTQRTAFRYSTSLQSYTQVRRIDDNHALYQDLNTYRVFAVELPVTFTPKVMMIN